MNHSGRNPRLASQPLEWLRGFHKADSRPKGTHALVPVLLALVTIAPKSSSAALPPIEAVHVQGCSVEFLWTAQSEGLALDTTTTLQPNPAWSPVAPELREVGDFMVAQLPLDPTTAFFRLRCSATLSDFWERRAVWAPDAGRIGRDIAFHFPSILHEGADLAAFYIGSYSVADKAKMVTARAVSNDGVHWSKDGIAVDVAEPGQSWVFQSEASIYHQTGTAEGDGWTACPDRDAAGYLAFGPYTTQILPGSAIAEFRLMTKSQPPSGVAVVTLDVYDSTAKQIIAIRSLYDYDFGAVLTYQQIGLPFAAHAGHALEFRTYWHKVVAVKQDRVSVSTKRVPCWDDRMASFASVWRDGGKYYLVYEGAAESSEWPGDIGLATSQDGRQFTKSQTNPILRHNVTGWERVNIGTPSLFKEDGTWYLFYHAWDGVDCRLGVATGTSLTNLSKYASNPILSTSPSGWDSGTIGRRSRIFKEGGWYYMAYEGSTDRPFDAARWSTGLARSIDLLSWEKCGQNPIVPQTVAGFGYDGPELVRITGDLYLYVRVSDDAQWPTKRFKLVLR